jgi:hypothetical protein
VTGELDERSSSACVMRAYVLRRCVYNGLLCIRQAKLEASPDVIDNIVDNIWILKRFAGRMSVDYPISDNISCLLRHCEGEGIISWLHENNNGSISRREWRLTYVYVCIGYRSRCEH